MNVGTEHVSWQENCSVSLKINQDKAVFFCRKIAVSHEFIVGDKVCVLLPVLPVTLGLLYHQSFWVCL